MTEQTTVHLLRHGEVHNPEGVLYGRLPDYHLSTRGKEMAEVVAEAIGGATSRTFASPRSSALRRPRLRWPASSASTSPPTTG